MKRNFVIIGAPDDRGVAIVGGRVGAHEGPAAIRKEIAAMRLSIRDVGDIAIEKTQEDTYRGLSQKIESLHAEGLFPILLGGGHDLSFGSLLGFLKVYPEGGIVNTDPHLDARPILEEGRYASGSPYRLLLEKTKLKGRQLMEFGYQPHCNDEGPLEYLKQKGVRLIPWPAKIEDTLRPFAQSVPALAISFDMDSVQSIFAPGVSAPAKIGYSDEEAYAFVRTVKTFSNLKHFEIMEVNPRFDKEGRTAKLAAKLIRELL